MTLCQGFSTCKIMLITFILLLLSFVVVIKSDKMGEVLHKI